MNRRSILKFFTGLPFLSVFRFGETTPRQREFREGEIVIWDWERKLVSEICSAKVAIARATHSMAYQSGVDSVRPHLFEGLSSPYPNQIWLTTRELRSNDLGGGCDCKCYDVKTGELIPTVTYYDHLSCIVERYVMHDGNFVLDYDNGCLERVIEHRELRLVDKPKGGKA